MSISRFSFCTILVFSTACKVWIVVQTIGTNDILAWHYFAHVADSTGLLSPYLDQTREDYFNHPPFMAFLVRSLFRIAGGDLVFFSILFKSLCVFSDVVSALCVWKIAELTSSSNRVKLSLILVILSPFSTLASSFHGNSDPIMMSLFLVSTSFLLKGRYGWAGVFYGASINIKLVPLLFAPTFFFWMRGKAQRWMFAFAVVAVLGVGFWPLVCCVPTDISISKVISHTGLYGMWGLTLPWKYEAGFFLSPVIYVFGTIGVNLVDILKSSILFFAIIIPGIIFGRLGTNPIKEERSFQFMRVVLLVMASFFVLTPGFGIQYLSWLSLPIVFGGVLITFGFVVLSSIFAIHLYSLWGGEWPWLIADSRFGLAWDRTVEYDSFLLWVFLLISLVLLHLEIRRVE